MNSTDDKPREVFLCRASGEGSHNFRVCADEAGVIKFYEEMFGRDYDRTLGSIERPLRDPDEWSNVGTALTLELYMATFDVWKVDPREISFAPSAVAPIGYPALIEKMLFIGELAHAEGWNDHPQVEDNGTRACRYIDEVRMALRSAQESIPSHVAPGEPVAWMKDAAHIVNAATYNNAMHESVKGQYRPLYTQSHVAPMFPRCPQDNLPCAQCREKCARTGSSLSRSVAMCPVGSTPAECSTRSCDRCFRIDAMKKLESLPSATVDRDAIIEECALLCEGFQIHYSQLGFSENERTAWTLAGQIREMKAGGARATDSGVKK